MKVAKCIIQNNNKIIILKRKKEKLFPGLWELPGGCVEQFEIPREAAIRECKEELNAGSNLCNLLFRFEMNDSFNSEVIMQIFVFEVILASEPLFPEHDKIALVEVENLQSYDLVQMDFNVLSKFLNTTDSPS